MPEPSRKRQKIAHSEQVTILHISDTHNLHDQIEKKFPFPKADLLLHTGDLTNNGTLPELRKANDWFGKVKHRFKRILIIGGNHDMRGHVDLKEVFTNATYLHHETVNILGLKIYGSPWIRATRGSDSGGPKNRFHQIPYGIDVLMTHGPPRNIFDVCNKGGGQWGSSGDYSLNKAIERAKPRAHLFGHLHEQRGFW